MKDSNIPIFTNTDDMNNSKGMHEIENSGVTDNLGVVQKLYQQGFRCIRYDDVNNEKMNVYLQNFDVEENTKTFEITDNTEKAELIKFIDNFK